MQLSAISSGLFEGMGQAPTGKEANRQSAIRFFGVAKAQVVTLTIVVNVDGAAIEVDGHAVGISPLVDVVFVDPGAHIITTKLAGYEGTQKGIQGARGTEQEVRLSLAPSTPPPPSPTGTTTSGALPPSPVPGPAQPAPGGAPARSLVPAFVLGGVGLGAAAVGVGLLVAAGGKSSDADSLSVSIRSSGGYCSGASNVPQSQCSALHSDTSSEQTLAQVGVGMFVGSAVALTAAGAYLLWPRDAPKEDRPKVTATPLFLPGGAGAVLQGSW
jgi:hypothetical protein